MSTNQEELINRLMELADDMISKAYVVTNGLRVSTIVLDQKIAEFICKKLRSEYNSDRWVFLTIPQAIEYAFSCGRECAFEELRLAQSKAEQPVDDSAKGEVNGKDQEFRESNL